MEDLGITIVWLAFIACIFFGWYFFLQARHKERIALIEKNADVAEIFKPRESRFRFSTLKFGMTIFGVGFGIILAVFMSVNGSLHSLIAPLAFGFMLLFGAIGSLIAYFIEKPKKQ